MATTGAEKPRSYKGHSATMGCIGGFLLGPIGVLLALATPKKN